MKLCAHAIHTGGLQELHSTVVAHAKACQLDPWRTVRLLCEPQFQDDVDREVRGKEA